MTQTLLEEPPALRQALQNKRIQQQQKILFYTLRQHVPIYMKMNLKKKKKKSVGRKIVTDVIQTCHKMACHLQRKQKLIYSEIIFDIKCTTAFLCLFREY